MALFEDFHKRNVPLYSLHFRTIIFYLSVGRHVRYDNIDLYVCSM
jgi:hypothetical protein